MFLFMLYATPVWTAFFWFFYKEMPPSWTSWIGPGSYVVHINNTSLLCGFLADLLPTGVLMLALYWLSKLFKNYENGVIFSMSNVLYYRKLAFAAFAKSAADVLFFSLRGIAFTYQNPPGERVSFIFLGTSQIILIFVGFIVLFISWIMLEARNASDEQAYTI